MKTIKFTIYLKSGQTVSIDLDEKEGVVESLSDICVNIIGGKKGFLPIRSDIECLWLATDQVSAINYEVVEE